MSTEYVPFPQVVQFLRGDIPLEPVHLLNAWPVTGSSEQVDFSEVKGQQHVKRAVEVAAAGGHNILFLGDIARTENKSF